MKLEVFINKVLKGRKPLCFRTRQLGKIKRYSIEDDGCIKCGGDLEFKKEVEILQAENKYEKLMRKIYKCKKCRASIGIDYFVNKEAE